MMKAELGSLEALHEGLVRRGFSGDLGALVHVIGNAGFLDAKPPIEDLLLSKDSSLRRAALVVLALVWACEDHRHTCERLAFLEPDPDDEIRRTAVAGLGTVLEGSQDASALRLVLPMIEDENTTEAFRDTAYMALLLIMGKSIHQIPWDAHIEWPHGADWSLVREAKAIAEGAERRAIE